jgi:hypothetical protein
MVRDVADRLIAFGVDEPPAIVQARMCVAIMLGAVWELRLTGDRETADATVRAFLDATWPRSV